ncbi:MAG: hypothetical protein V1763_03060 [Parcubacteria group bacterium]
MKKERRCLMARIKLVSADLNALYDLRRILESAGYLVEITVSAELALADTKLTGWIQLVITDKDLRADEYSGDWLAKKVRELGIPVIVLTEMYDISTLLANVAQLLATGDKQPTETGG